MPETRDSDLMQAYADRGSESAFAELVQRHINLVYSVAFRCVGNSEDARDVTQSVFVILAQKATRLRHRTTLTGWLYEATRFTSRQLLRTRARRQAREQEAYMQSALNDPDSETAWMEFEPLLEEGMARLSEKERTLIALRFFENKSIAETSALLGIQEWAARKRAERALERLRIFFAARGVVMGTSAIGTVIGANSVQAAPLGLVKTTTAAALAKGAASTASTLTLIKGALKLMAWTKAKTAVVAGVAIAMIVGVTVSVPALRTTLKNIPQKVVANLPAEKRKEARIQQMGAMKMSVWPALMKYSEEHQGIFPTTMQQLQPYLPPGLTGMDDDHWRITAGNKQAKPTTPELLTFCEQINQPAGQPHIVLYADGHVAYRK